MSVVVTILRPGTNPLSRSEIEQALADNEHFTQDDDGAWFAVDPDSGTDLFLNVEEDEAWTDGRRAWLGDAPLEKLRLLAASLGARVVCEESGDITEAEATIVDAPNTRIGKPAAIVAGILAVLLAPLLFFFAIARLPWVVWRITRQK